MLLQGVAKKDRPHKTLNLNFGTSLLRGERRPRRLDDDGRLARALQRPRRAEAREARADDHDVGVEIVGHLIRCCCDALVRAFGWIAAGVMRAASYLY